MLDGFNLNDGHYCLVFECLGRSLYDFMKGHDYTPFPLYCVRDFARQLLDALDFMHGFGLIHTDLKPENILLTDNRERTYTSCNERGSDSKKQHQQHQQQVPYSTAIKVIDFGGATYDNEKKSSVINTRQYRAPEVILELGWSTPSDLWSLGCILAELYIGELLFETHDNDEHLALIERIVGRFPPMMIRNTKLKSSLSFSSSATVTTYASKSPRSNHTNNYNNNTHGGSTALFDGNGWHRMGDILSSSSLEHVRTRLDLDSMVLDCDRSSGLGLLLRSLLVMDPRMRKTAYATRKLPFL
mmetsp:Transcript_31358/g.37312  ORF Transcript_31358/g.37312 Transcript_31358/m.37312 type:complete len:300 (+) Transcript_31358:499-1398(+)